MASQANKEKRLVFEQECLALNEVFEDVIFTDETKIQMGCNASHQCYKKPKHPYQVPFYMYIYNGPYNANYYEDTYNGILWMTPG